MTDRAPLILTDRQRVLVDRYANSLPLDSRDLFRAAVKRHLAGAPSDAAVMAAINAGLDFAKEHLP